MSERVHIEFQRVQTWLFSVPRLQAMVGANTLLGEVLRIDLVELAQNGGGARPWTLARQATTLTVSVPDIDPLKSHDDPAADAELGIFARDGGHFEAQFERGVDAFIEDATELIRRKLPGLRYKVEKGLKPSVRPVSRGIAVTPVELPVLEPCEWMGRGVASGTISPGGEDVNVSVQVGERVRAFKKVRDGAAQDLASLLVTETNLGRLRRPLTFEELAGRGYLAVIHADGNGIGAAGETHYYRNRVLVRAALKVAINAACAPASAGQGASFSDVAPLVLMMLGGDDVLIVSKASVAMTFVVNCCKELDRLQMETTDTAETTVKLTLGVGVAIAHPKLPFHRLHELAEALSGSAKRRYRGLPDGERASVVDWAIYNGFKASDLAAVRADEWICGTGGERRILSRRPLMVLGSGLDRLEGLLDGVSRLGADPPRSPLRFLIEQLPRGRALADLAFQEMSPDAKRALSRAGVNQLWESAQTSGSAIVTSVLDLVELFEIPRLGRPATAQPAVANVGNTDV